MSIPWVPEKATNRQAITGISSVIPQRVIPQVSGAGEENAFNTCAVLVPLLAATAVVQIWSCISCIKNLISLKR